VKSAVKSVRTVAAMERGWKVQAAVDAVGEASWRVRARATGTEPGRAPHLVVRAGPVRVYCLDGRAVADLAAAWAQAYATTCHLLPVRLPRYRTAEITAGHASTVVETVVEGRQPWDVTPPDPAHPYAAVSTGWLVVRVHDVAALTVQVRAWSEATALGRQVLRSRPASFNRLLAIARDVGFVERERHAALERPAGRDR